MLAKGSTRTTWKKSNKGLICCLWQLYISSLFTVCFYQLFGLSFWRHPFTAEDPLVSKWCNATFLQICSHEETNSSISWMAWVSKCSANVHFWWTIPLTLNEEKRFKQFYCQKIISGNSHLPFCVHLQDVHHVNHDVLVRLLVFPHPERYSQPSWTTCAHMFLPSLFFPFSHLKKLNGHILLKPDCIKISSNLYIHYYYFFLH